MYIYIYTYVYTINIYVICWTSRPKTDGLARLLSANQFIYSRPNTTQPYFVASQVAVFHEFELNQNTLESSKTFQSNSCQMIIGQQKHMSSFGEECWTLDAPGE